MKPTDTQWLCHLCRRSIDPEAVVEHLQNYHPEIFEHAHPTETALELLRRRPGGNVH